MVHINDYIPIVGQSTIDDLKLLAERLKGKVIQHINYTSVGGGVAEILNRMVPLLGELGVDSRWDLIKGGAQFFDVTKKFHNALHGRPQDITDRDLEIFMETTEANVGLMNTYGDIVFVHDPQPIGLIKKKSGNKWLWRCHIDVSHPHKKVWNFLMSFIPSYDAAVFSSPIFSQSLPIRQFFISPSIDPLSDKNKELSQDEIDAALKKYNIVRDKPIVTQISRFDRLKDPAGVIDTFLQEKNTSTASSSWQGGRPPTILKASRS